MSENKRKSVFSDSAYESKVYREYLDSLPVADRVLDEDLDDEPEAKELYGRYGDMVLVGHGEKTNVYCGTFRGFYGCADVKAHNKTSLDGVNYADKIYLHKTFHYCDKPSCPVCYKLGWAHREAGNIGHRIAEASKRFGKAEHVIIGVPESDYGLSLEKLRLKVANRVLRDRGVIGGCLIFHGFRYRSSDILLKSGVRLPMGHFWSPHFHCIGFILGGYGKCRHCGDYAEKGFLACAGCFGFEGRTRRCWEKDRYIVKVKDERRSVAGTAGYQLNHACTKVNSVRFHVVTWFGTCSYRKLKVTPEMRKKLCPICQSEIYKLHYFGAKAFVLDRSLASFEEDTFEDMYEDGVNVWLPAGEHDFG